MTAELLVNVTPSETRVAYIDGGILQEIHIEREARRGIVGNIYKGRVSRVLPGMQAAFVDIGLDKAAFLHASDIMPHTECVAGEEQKQFAVRDISELVRQGQDLMVQVVKDPLGTKGARLTTDITLPSRYLVFMPGASHVGVSQRIESESERERLKKVVSAYCDEQGGFIIRTAAEGISEEDLASDAAYLKRVWTKVMERKKRNQTRYRLYGELALAQRVLRDFADAQLDRIRVDSRLTYEALLEFTAEYIPEMPGLLEHYTGRQPIFDLYDVENEIQRALERKVELKSGGYLIIDQTEAMTTVDINTGAFVGHRNLDDTIFNTNIEATQAIARQLRLRNLGGIIIIDFIDMNNEDHRRRVLHSLEQALSKDRVKTSINGFSQLGLVEMTRKRTRESVEHVLCNECPTCHGRGTVKTVETVCYEIMRCPGHVQIFNQGLKSYRDLPLRMAEFGSCHRNEPSGALHGLMRVRGFTQDDAHIFCTEDQVREEVNACIRMVYDMYSTFGFEKIVVKLSTRPEKRIGSDETWDRAEADLAVALEENGIPFEYQLGEGAFYGPKIEFTLYDCLDRAWQCGTVQLDFSLPQRLSASYVGEDNERQVPVMIHRAILGSLERFIGILTEEFAGFFPTWLAPVQVVVMNITDSQADYVKELTQKLQNAGIRVKADLRNEKIGFKIREHTLRRVPYMLVCGDKEVEAGKVAVRTRRGKDLGSLDVSEVIEKLQQEIRSRSLQQLEE